MLNQHIEKFLDYYTDDEKLKNPQYAVLLKGKWGSGKTYFINEYKKQLKQKYIYVSLYGITSYDEIETKFLQSTNPKIFNNKTIFASKIANEFINEKIKGSLKDVKKILSSLNAKERILIFDDIERCSMDIIDLLGYINNFVEHQSYKVILIANEEELEKTEKYTKIKEKLIGKTFEFKSDINQAYNSFVEELSNEKILRTYKNIIVKLFEKSKCNNLRLLRQGLFDFKRVYDLVLKEYERKEEFIKDIIKLYFIFIFEYRSGKFLLFNSLKKDEQKSWDSFLKTTKNKTKEEKEKTIYEKIYERYRVYILNSLILNLETWKEIIRNSYINIEKIKDEILESKYFIDDNTENWKRLWNYMELTDSNFYEVFNKVYSNLKKYKYNDLFQVMLISSTILKIKSLGLIQENEKEIFNVLEKQIDNLFKEELVHKSLILHKDITINNHSFGTLGFDTDFESYKKIKKYIEKKIVEEEKNIFRNSYTEIEEAIKNDSSNLYTLLSHSNNREIPYYNKPIFAYIDISNLAKLLIESSNHSQYTFGGIIEDRYKHNIFTSKLEEEFDNIYKLHALIKEEADKKEGKISGYRLKQNLLETFEKAIKYIENYKNIDQ